jgi:hypothetical protein
MVFNVRTIGLADLKVFWSVVTLVVIDVVDAFSLGKKAPDASFGHKSMLINIAVSVSTGVIVNLDRDISVNCCLGPMSHP